MSGIVAAPELPWASSDNDGEHVTVVATKNRFVSVVIVDGTESAGAYVGQGRDGFQQVDMQSLTWGDTVAGGRDCSAFSDCQSGRSVMTSASRYVYVTKLSGAKFTCS